MKKGLPTSIEFARKKIKGSWCFKIQRRNLQILITNTSARTLHWTMKCNRKRVVNTLMPSMYWRHAILCFPGGKPHVQKITCFTCHQSKLHVFSLESLLTLVFWFLLRIHQMHFKKDNLRWWKRWIWGLNQFKKDRRNWRGECNSSKRKWNVEKSTRASTADSTQKQTH